MIRSSAALLVKDLRTTGRSPLFALVSILVPVAFTLLYAIVVHVSTTATVAVADEDQSDSSRSFTQVMRTMRNDDGPYYEILTTDPGSARRLYASGRVGALLTVPSGFQAALKAGEPPQIRLTLMNINADGTKNQHIRLEQALRAFNTLYATHQQGGRLRISEERVLPQDITITVYLGSALMVFASLYSGMVSAGVAIAREWEERTAKMMVLSPAGPWALLAGKWMGSLAMSVATVGVATVGIVAVLGYPAGRIGLSSVAALLIVWLYGAALGTLLGVTLRKSLPLIPIAVILAVAHFLVCGYESYLRGFAHGGLVEVLWQVTHWVPLSRLFDSVRFEVARLDQPTDVTTGIAFSLVIAGLLAVLASWRLTRTFNFRQGQ